MGTQEPISPILSAEGTAQANQSLNNGLRTLPLLPLKNVVLLPRSIVPIIVGRPSSIEAVEYALKHDRAIFVTAQKRAETEHPDIVDVYAHGTRSKILQVMRLPNGALKILVEGVRRAYVVRSLIIENFLGVECEDLTTAVDNPNNEFEASWRYVVDLFAQYTELNGRVPNDLVQIPQTVEEVDFMADTVAVHVNMTFVERQKVLETVDLKARLANLGYHLQKEVDILRTEKRIQQQVQQQVSQNQKEYYLNEQLKAINRELGRDELSVEIEQLREKVKKSGMPAEAAGRCERELNKLEQAQSHTAESAVSRNYVDWMLNLPWNKVSQDSLSIDQAEKILNDGHSGLKTAKERVLEFIAAKKFSSELKKAPIICFVGPPGVGKTSLASSIAQSLGREFVRISLGGVKDEAAIRGHRRTYIGAIPGKIIQAMRKASTVNPVMLLDEVDKLAHDITGDPSAALLEVLDPEQNHTFTDHYLDVEYDLSKIMFIVTANTFDTIPYPLLDRMEIIQLSGYTTEEKITIAREFLIPKKLKEHALKKNQCKISSEILATLINNYTKEAGVRQLERVIAKLMRKAIQKLLKTHSQSLLVNEKLVLEWLGQPKFKPTSLDKDAQTVGLVRGLAWTEFGGDVLEIETTIFSGKGNVTMTGQMGEVMQESAQAALSYIRARSAELGIKKNLFSNHDIHIHIPEGATPKDGPSAGITMACALISALTRIPVKPDFAMTGEVTLRGRVLPVGGLKEKILAARRYGIKSVIVPKDNASDVQEELKDVEHGVDLKYASSLEDVIAHVFVSDPFKKQKKSVN